MGATLWVGTKLSAPAGSKLAVSGLKASRAPAAGAAAQRALGKHFPQIHTCSGADGAIASGGGGGCRLSRRRGHEEQQPDLEGRTFHKVDILSLRFRKALPKPRWCLSS